MTDVPMPHIHLRDIDTDHLDDVEDNREAVRFRIRLSEMPPFGWNNEFDQIYKQTPYTLKPPVEVKDDALEVIFLPRYAGELQGFVQFLGLIARQANEELHKTDELHTSDAQEQRKQEFRQALQRVRVPQEP